MSTTDTAGQSEPSADDAPLEKLRELESEWETLAETDLPIAPYAQNALDRLAEADCDA